MENFKIEDAKPEDAEAIRAIVKSRWLELYPNEKYGITLEDLVAIDWFSSEYIANRQKEITESGDRAHIIVLKNDQDKVVGFAEALKFDNYGEIEAMYVIKELEGKGFGKKLMLKALEWLGNQDIILKVVAYNYHAIEFYKKFGFKETTNKVVHTGTQLPSGKEIPRIEMLRPRS